MIYDVLVACARVNKLTWCRQLHCHSASGFIVVFPTLCLDVKYAMGHLSGESGEICVADNCDQELGINIIMM